ncbi:MAG: hypothetical protein H7Y09_01325 [Chitinophagaceae bacterium]|nr:hypothetical protein [Anaerolineae bacterium]
MTHHVLEILAVSVVFGIIFGPLIARSSSRREKVYGGALAQVFHVIGAGAMVGILPGVIAGLIFGGGFGTAFPVALGLLATSLFSMVLFAIVEKPARPAPQPTEDRGWTEEDARKSGL